MQISSLFFLFLEIYTTIVEGVTRPLRDHYIISMGHLYPIFKCKTKASNDYDLIECKEFR